MATYDIYRNGKHYDDIFFQGKSADQVYIGNKLVWEKNSIKPYEGIWEMISYSGQYFFRNAAYKPTDENGIGAYCVDDICVFLLSMGSTTSVSYLHECVEPNNFSDMGFACFLSGSLNSENISRNSWSEGSRISLSSIGSKVLYSITVSETTYHAYLYISVYTFENNKIVKRSKPTIKDKTEYMHFDTTYSDGSDYIVVAGYYDNRTYHCIDKAFKCELYGNAIEDVKLIYLDTGDSVSEVLHSVAAYGCVYAVICCNEQIDDKTSITKLRCLAKTYNGVEWVKAFDKIIPDAMTTVNGRIFFKENDRYYVTENDKSYREFDFKGIPRFYKDNEYYFIKSRADGTDIYTSRDLISFSCIERVEGIEFRQFVYDKGSKTLYGVRSSAKYTEEYPADKGGMRDTVFYSKR